MLTYISNSAHYKEVLSRVLSVKHMLWIGTADIKDLSQLCPRLTIFSWISGWFGSIKWSVGSCFRVFEPVKAFCSTQKFRGKAVPLHPRCTSYLKPGTIPPSVCRRLLLPHRAVWPDQFLLRGSFSTIFWFNIFVQRVWAPLSSSDRRFWNTCMNKNEKNSFQTCSFIQWIFQILYRNAAFLNVCHLINSAY